MSSEQTQTQGRRFVRRRRQRRAPGTRRVKVMLKIAGIDVRKIEDFTHSLATILKTRGAQVSGPIRLPTKVLYLSVRKSPCGEGTPTYDFYEMRIHKRLITAELSSRDLVYLVGVSVPRDIWTEIRIKQK